MRLVTIGNSFSANATEFLPALAKAGGHKLVHSPIVIGGCSLERHARETAQPREDGPSWLEEVLSGGKWDLVTIQQCSILSHDVETYRPYAAELCHAIARHAPDATVMLHQTWAYRCDDPRFPATKPTHGEPASQTEMYEGLVRAYDKIAGELGVGIIPVGDAFHEADNHPEWGYKPSPTNTTKALREPDLPEQTHSLHKGWHWHDGELCMDGHHASAAGMYLGACVWYEVLFGEKVTGNGFIPDALAPAYARFLQETAHRALEARALRKAMNS